VAQILRTCTVDDMTRLAMEAGTGLEPADFADTGQHLDEPDDLAFARYGLGPADVNRLRQQFAA
jgi:hypothetical protein